jgi:hypothetical protein
MITVQLMGGIGNQMFQYAFARRLSYENKMPLRMDIVTGFKNDPYKRKYALGGLRIHEQFVRAGEIPWCMRSGGLVRRSAFLCQSVVPASRRSIITEKREFVFDAKSLTRKRSVYVFGYWQSEKYFEPIEHILQSEFALKHPPLGRTLELMKELQECSSVSIHVRRLHGIADGKPLAYDINLHGACSLGYYEQAVEIIKSRVRNPQFIIFSDDPQWCKEHLNIASTAKFAADEGVVSDAEELQLMSFCQHHIISNSTFGWWGAWLGNNSGKVVIAPSRWFNSGRHRTPDLLPSGWITI